MRIKKLKLKNWAGFSEREFDLDGSVVILVGKNGGGKTTLMNSITYALQGKLPNKTIASDFIRNFGLKDGASSAEITADFYQGGHDFNVWRKLDPKGSERKLTLSTGAEFKYAEQVDEQIGALLGTDVDTVSNVMFIPQGDLKNILFGTASDQEKLLIKILDIGYLQDVYEALSAKISTLSIGIDPTLDTRIIENTDLTNNLIGLLDTNTQELNSKIKITDSQVSELEANLVLLENLDKDMRAGEYSAINLGEELVLLHSRSNIDLIKSKMTTISNDSGKKDELKKLSEIFSANKSKLEILNALQKAVNSKESLLLELSSDDALYKSMQFINLGGLNSNLVTFVKNNSAEIKSIDSLKERVSRLNSEIETLKELIKTKRELLLVTTTKASGYKFFLHAKDEGVVCSTCQSTVTAENVKKGKEELVSFIQQEHTTSAELSQLTLSLNTLGQEHITLSRRLRELEDLYSSVGSEVLTYMLNNPAVLDQRKFSELSVKYKELEVLDKFVETHSLVVKTTYGISDLDKDKITTEINSVNTLMGSTLDVIQQLEQDVRSAVSQDDLDKLDQFTSKEVILSELKQNNEFLKTKVITQAELVKAMFDNFQVSTTPIQQFRDKLTYIKSYSIEIRNLEDSHKLLTFRIEEACNEKLKLLKVKKDNQVKIDLINDLSDLKESFSRKGFASKFIQAKFEQLISVTKENLNKLSVQFEIDQDPGKPLSFLFKRHDNGNNNWLPQKLMSGGQRVRLCLAFIMAIQQVLVPNLGFLLLDEPSNHMDETGADDLRDFLIRIRPELEAKNMQLIVCDHNKSITSAQTKFIEL